MNWTTEDATGGICYPFYIPRLPIYIHASGSIHMQCNLKEFPYEALHLSTTSKLYARKFLNTHLRTWLFLIFMPNIPIQNTYVRYIQAKIIFPQNPQPNISSPLLHNSNGVMRFKRNPPPVKMVIENYKCKYSKLYSNIGQW